jgi:hypothetical protein
MLQPLVLVHVQKILRKLLLVAVTPCAYAKV